MNKNEIIIYTVWEYSLREIIGSFLFILFCLFAFDYFSPDLKIKNGVFSGAEIGLIGSVILRVFFVFGSISFILSLPTEFNNLFRVKPTIHFFEKGFRAGIITRKNYVPWEDVLGVDWEEREITHWYQRWPNYFEPRFIKYYPKMKISLKNKRKYFYCWPWSNNKFNISLRAIREENPVADHISDKDFVIRIVDYINERKGLSLEKLGVPLDIQNEKYGGRVYDD